MMIKMLHIIILCVYFALYAVYFITVSKLKVLKIIYFLLKDFKWGKRIIAVNKRMYVNVYIYMNLYFIFLLLIKLF